MLQSPFNCETLEKLKNKDGKPALSQGALNSINSKQGLTQVLIINAATMFLVVH